MKLFNGFFFTSKAFLPVYIAFAQQEGLGWDLVVWEHGGGRQQMVPDSSFIVMLWERGAYFNPDLKQSFFRKVKHHTFSRQEPRSRHPRAKPFRLLEEMILQRSKPGDVVLAPACQGATLPLACERHGRRYIAFQANPKWYAEAAQQLEATPPPAAMGPEGADAPQQMLLNYG
jgi:DNA modification methylase